MRNFFYSWRFYTFGREQYYDCMNKVFSNNLLALRQASIFVTIFAACFSLFPLIIERDLIRAGIYLGVGVIALLISFCANYVMQQINVNNRIIYILTAVYYANITSFGIYLGVWANPDNFAVLFMCILICALVLFITPPLYNLCLTLAAMISFLACAILIKPAQIWIMDISNVLFAGFLASFLNWHITKLRMGLEISANKLEEERNKYIDQSTTDELTRLRNRRDYMQTFHRFISNYRASDDWLCVAIADIDFFKGYNDHYGHPKGDDCLRSIGEVLNGLKDSLGIYTARVGGEEFSLLWFEREISHVDAVVAHLCKQISDLKIPHEKSKVSEYVTMSIGIYVIRCGTHQDTQTLYDLADKALYAAKAGGRNCAVINGDEIKEYKITPQDNA